MITVCTFVLSVHKCTLTFLYARMHAHSTHKCRHVNTHAHAQRTCTNTHAHVVCTCACAHHTQTHLLHSLLGLGSGGRWSVTILPLFLVPIVGFLALKR